MWGKKTCIKISQSEDIVEFIKKRKRNNKKEREDQVLSFRKLKSQFDKKFEAIDKNLFEETKHLAKMLKNPAVPSFHPIIKVIKFNMTSI